MSSEATDTLLWSQLWPADAPAQLSAALAGKAHSRKLHHGEWLYAKGDAATGLIGVRRGMIRNVHVAENGRELLFGLFPAGSWFGEISLFDEAPRPLHAIAEGETEVLILAAEEFRAVLDAHPEGYRHFARVLCRKLRVAFEQIEMQQQPLGLRLAKRLLDLATIYGEPAAEGVRIKLALPQEDLARMLGTTRQSINKELRLLAQQGLLVQKGKGILLPHPQALRALLPP